MTTAVAAHVPAQASKTPAFDALEPKQRKFVREFLVDFCGAKAARRAGYSEKTANVQASQLLSKLNVRAAVDEVMAVEAGVTRSRILQELARIAFADPGDVMDVDANGNLSLKSFKDMPEDARVAIASIKQKPNEYGQERELKMHDKVSALQLLAKASGLLRDAPAVNVNATINARVGVLVAPAVASEDEWEAEMRAENGRTKVIENNLKRVA